jgi:diaminopimelate decarboxylase
MGDTTIPAGLIGAADNFGLPLYVYDGNTIQRQYEKMKNALTVDRCTIHYACKALSNISVLRLMKSLGAGLDCVSIEEVYLGLHSGFEPKEIIFTPNSVSFREIEIAIEKGVKLNIDNTSILEMMGHQYPGIPISIRVNPHVLAGGHTKTSVGHIDSKFGISIYQLPLVERIVENMDLHVDGVHMHTGSDILDVELFLRAADILFEVARKFKNLNFIDFGSGFKIKYKRDDHETDIKRFGEEISGKFNSFCHEYGKTLELKLEPGKYLVSDAGYFLAHTNVVKQTVSTVFAGLDSGFNHFIRPMFYDAYHEILNLSNPDGQPRLYTVVGYICETDTFGHNRKIPEIRPGDILAFKNAGAYAFNMASNYNSRLLPAEVLIYRGEQFLIRERQTFDQLLINQPDPAIPFSSRKAVSG